MGLGPVKGHTAGPILVPHPNSESLPRVEIYMLIIVGMGEAIAPLEMGGESNGQVVSRLVRGNG